MSPSQPLTSEAAKRRTDRWDLFLVASLVIHGSMLLCPCITVPPRGAEHRRLVLIFAVFLLVPLVWSLSIVACSRTQRERAVAYCSLVASIFWAVGAAGAAADL
jgi:hypothetical protein